MENKVLLVLVDGLRPDSLERSTHPFLKNFISETNNSFHEEQIYNYFGWVLVSDGQELSDDQIKKIFKSDNQILQSYIIMYNISNTINLEKYLQDDDSKWFVNYHLIYKQNSSKEVRENLIKKYLLPKSCAVNNGNMKKSAREYVNFYVSNMLACNIFIKRIEQVESEICDYLNDLQQEKEEFSSDSLSIYSDV